MPRELNALQLQKTHANRQSTSKSRKHLVDSRCCNGSQHNQIKNFICSAFLFLVVLWAFTARVLSNWRSCFLNLQVFFSICSTLSSLGHRIMHTKAAYIYIYILGVARCTDVTVRYVPRFGGHGSIRFRYNRKKKDIYYARFLFIYFEQTIVQIKKIHLDVKILHIITCYISKIRFVFTNKSRPLYSDY